MVGFFGGGCCGMVVVPPFVSLGVHFISFVFLYRLPRVWFFQVRGFLCVVGGVCLGCVSERGFLVYSGKRASEPLS